jgi:hypothetical protein
MARGFKYGWIQGYVKGWGRGYLKRLVKDRIKCWVKQWVRALGTICRVGKSAGTWEPSSQKVFQSDRKKLSFELIFCQFLNNFFLTSLDTRLLHNNAYFFLQYEHKSYVFYAERNQHDNVVPRKCFNFFHLGQ